MFNVSKNAKTKNNNSIFDIMNFISTIVIAILNYLIVEQAHHNLILNLLLIIVIFLITYIYQEKNIVYLKQNISHKKSILKILSYAIVLNYDNNKDYALKNAVKIVLNEDENDVVAYLRNKYTNLFCNIFIEAYFLSTTQNTLNRMYKQIEEFFKIEDDKENLDILNSIKTYYIMSLIILLIIGYFYKDNTYIFYFSIVLYLTYMCSFLLYKKTRVSFFQIFYLYSYFLKPFYAYEEALKINEDEKYNDFKMQILNNTLNDYSKLSEDDLFLIKTLKNNSMIKDIIFIKNNNLNLKYYFKVATILLFIAPIIYFIIKGIYL